MRRYFCELAEEVLTRKMNWYNGISVDLKMVPGTMAEHYERRHEKWLLYLQLMKVNALAAKNVSMSALPKFLKWSMKNPNP
jgi:hypothetical protein